MTFPVMKKSINDCNNLTSAYFDNNIKKALVQVAIQFFTVK